jgi:hypothetical protein
MQLAKISAKKYERQLWRREEREASLAAVEKTQAVMDEVEWLDLELRVQKLRDCGGGGSHSPAKRKEESVKLIESLPVDHPLNQLLCNRLPRDK